jgi:hypothetical protein
MNTMMIRRMIRPQTQRGMGGACPPKG